MRRFVGTLAFLCALSLLTSIPSYASDYEPSYYLMGLYASGETYTGTLYGETVPDSYSRSASGSFSIPTNLDPEFKWAVIGASYGSVTYDVGASYTMAITITMGVTGDYISDSVPILYSSELKYPLIDMKSTKTVSTEGVLTTGSSSSYTFTYTDIPYDNVVGRSFFRINIPLSYFSSDLDGEIYILNSYFGLSSDYDPDKYNSQVLGNLEDINNSLGGIQDSIDEGNDKLDGIKDSLDNQYENDKNKAESDLDGSSADVENAISSIPDYSENYLSILEDLEDAMLTTETATSIPLPNGEFEFLGQSLDIFAGHTEVDVSWILANPDIQTLIGLSKGFSVLFTMGICVYWVYAMYSWFNGLGPAPEIPIVDPGFASKSDPWGVKWR